VQTQGGQSGEVDDTGKPGPPRSTRRRLRWAESGLSQPLPPIVMITLALGLPYEPTQAASFLPLATVTGPSAAYLVHAGNAAEAGGVGELGTKPDPGPPIIKEFITCPRGSRARLSRATSRDRRTSRRR
jgi:hypothetical protein